MSSIHRSRFYSHFISHTLLQFQIILHLNCGGALPLLLRVTYLHMNFLQRHRAFLGYVSLA